MKATVLAIILALTSLPLFARVLTPEETICREDSKQLAELKSELTSFENIVARIEALSTGEIPPSFSANQLVLLLTGDFGESYPLSWPDAIQCDTLKTDYVQARKNLVWTRRYLTTLRQSFWGGQNKEAKDQMINIWNSRQRLLVHYQELKGLTDQSAPAFQSSIQSIDQVHNELQALRLNFFQLLKGLTGDITRSEISDWLELWQKTFATPLEAHYPPRALLQGLPPATRETLEEHFQLAQLDLLVMSKAINYVRGWLWKNHRPAFRAAVAELQGGRRQLLVDESLAVRNILHWLYLDAVTDYEAPTTGRHAVLWRFLQGFEYILGFLSFFLLAYVARQSEAPAATFISRFARRNRRNRLYSQFFRLIAGLPTLLPWIIGLLGLKFLTALFFSHDLVLLLPLVPFAWLYIVYGLLCLAGEWLMQRVVQQAGVFLSGDQLQTIEVRVRRAARLVILPWLIKDLLSLAIGPSLLLSIFSWLTLLAILVSTGLLLRPWRQEFIRAVQSVTPEPVDFWVERLLGGPYFVVLAPLAAPPVILALIVNFSHRAMVDFDWYRKLVARGFKLRAATSDVTEPGESDEEALAGYRQWFDSPPEDAERPYITTGLLPEIQKILSPWLADQSEENTLLISGERGSGKSMALRKLHQQMGDEHEEIDVLSIEVPAKTVTEDAVKTLVGTLLATDLATGPAELVKTDEDRRPTVVILDNAQNFFLREVGGFAGWETLLSLTNARLRNIFWIIVINNQSWAFLSNVYGKDYQFRTILKTKPWSQNEIRSLVLSRNQLSGSKIRYDSILLATRGPEAGSIRNAEQLYFSLLWDACRGNPMLALQLWLTSVTVNEKTVTVGLPDELPVQSLERLGDDYHFVYAALVLHENMTSEELVDTTAISQRVVRSALKTAFDAGFVERTAEGRYRIIPLWYPTITKLLGRKNLLHE